MKERSDKTSLERLNNLLRRIDDSPTGIKGVQAEGEEESLRRELLELTGDLAAPGPADERHFELETLTRFVDERRARGESWDMPVHLSRCPLCLETFQILLEGVPKPSDAALRRFVGDEAKVIPFPTRWKTALKVAASIAVVIGAVLFLSHPKRTSAHVTEGSVAFETGNVLHQGVAIPDDALVVAKDPTSATFADGSKVDLTANTKVAFHRSFHGNTTVALQAGSLVATVAKQPKGREFVVHTPLGDVVVVGTRFRVTCKGEDVMVFQSDGGQPQSQGRKEVVRAMHVTVFEGVVRVKGRTGEARVSAGQTAVLREDEPGIDVTGDKS